MNELQQKHCKVCNELKNRIQKGTFTKKTNKRWVNENDKQWCGHVCPDCHARRSVVNMRRLRSTPKEKQSDESSS